MLPALAILRLGRRGRVAVPVPVFLLWPFVGIAWLLVAVASVVKRRPTGSPDFATKARIALSALNHLSGLRVDVRSRDGTYFYLRLI